MKLIYQYPSVNCYIPPITELNCDSKDVGKMEVTVTNINFAKRTFSFRVVRILQNVRMPVKEIYFSKNDVAMLALSGAHEKLISIQYSVRYVSSLGKISPRAPRLLSIEVIEDTIEDTI